MNFGQERYSWMEQDPYTGDKMPFYMTYPMQNTLFEGLTESAALCPRAAGGGAALLLRGGAARRRLRLVGHHPAIFHMVLYICARAVGPAVIRSRHGTAPFR